MAYLIMQGRPAAQILSLLIALLSGLSCAVADEPSDPGKEGRFMRLRRSTDGEITALQTAVVRYAPTRGTGPVVDLIGAIHVADREYYEKLNERFDDYDVVLYELVAPDEKIVPQPGQRSGNPVTMMQVGMTQLLGLDFQLDCIDYRKPNLVRADLTLQEFAQSMDKRGESSLQYLFRLMGQGIALQSKDPGRSNDARLLAAFFAKDRDTRLKRAMAEEFERGLGSLSTVFEGPQGSTIVTVRNRRAMDELDKQVRSGKTKLAIFYGAAHLPDMADQLRERFGLLPVKTSWLVAWKIESEE